MKVIFEKRIYLLLVSIFLILWLVTTLFYRSSALNTREQYLIQSNQSYAEKIDLTINRYYDFSNYLFNTLIDDTTTSLMVGGSSEDPILKNTSRTELYNHLKLSYEEILEFNFRQLHFHLPNGESFLRFHSPETFGDNLMDVRTSIRLANTEWRPVQGFEEGRIFNGYRFVFPLFHENNHVGSVEISISIATVIDTLFTIEPSRTHTFTIQRSIVEDLVFDAYLENYQTSPLHDGYLFDIGVEQLSLARRTLFEDDHYERFLEHLKPLVDEPMRHEEDFSVHTTYEGRHYTAHFVSIRNIDALPIGYVYSISEDHAYDALIVRDRMAYGVISIFYLSILASSLVYATDKERIREISKTDYLTKLSNRLHFIEVSEKELSRSLRHNLAMSIILFDVDHFKHINDSKGHFVGDEVLKGLAKVLTTHLRKYDTSARWGGEEFMVLLPQTTSQAAIEVVLKLQRMIKILSNELGFPVTVSFGIVSLDDSKHLDDLLKLADAKLYQAKENGRNQYVI